VALVAILTGRGKIPTRIMRHSVVRETPIIRVTSFARTNLTASSGHQRSTLDARRARTAPGDHKGETALRM